jgi:hypothetical protein
MNLRTEEWIGQPAGMHDRWWPSDQCAADRAAVTGPQASITASNWNVVASGSVVTWTQTVTIPSANATP